MVNSSAVDWLIEKVKTREYNEMFIGQKEALYAEARQLEREFNRFDNRIEDVTDWAAARDLIKRENAPKQMLKVVEEIGETAAAMLKQDREKLIDGIGDSFVTLIILSRQLGLSPAECLQSAWDEIKNRTGRTVNGTFIKD